MLFARRLAVAVLLAAIGVAPAAMVPAAQAAETEPYTAAALEKAEAAGKPIIVHVSADWCTTCAAQRPIVQELLKDPKYKNLVLFKVDYDKQKEAMRSLNVQERSTFVAFKGKKEVGRSTGETDKTSIQALFDMTS